MLNVIKSECYKTKKRLYPYLFVGIILALILAMVITIAMQNQLRADGVRSAYEDIVTLIIPLLSLGIYIIPPVTDMVFSEEYKYQTLKNTLAFGTSRVSIYFGKLLTQLLVALISLAAIIVVTAGSSYLLLGVGDANVAGGITQLLLERVALALPLWIGALCISNMLAFAVKSSALYAMVYVGLFIGLAPILELMGELSPAFLTIRSWLITPQFAYVTMGGAVAQAGIWKCVGVGLGYAVLSCALGYLLFRKREVK